MRKFRLLKNIILKHRSRLIITYILFSLEMLGSLLRPFFLGEAVNGLIKGNYYGLILLSAVHLAWLIVGTLRHMYDTRTYTAIYTSLVTKLMARRPVESADISKLSAHSTLAREFIDFLEFDLIYIVEAAYNIIGALILLWLYNSAVVGTCLLILLPVITISFRYGKKMNELNKNKNDELEKQVAVISSGNKLAMNKHYNNLSKWQIKISDMEAWNFGVMELMVLLVISASLLVTNKFLGSALLAGDLIGIYNYILKFVSGLDVIPYTVQKITSMTDISRRIEVVIEDFAEKKPAYSFAKKNKRLSGAA